MMAERTYDALSLSVLLDGIAVVNPHDDRDICGLCLDSRQIKKGECFVALSGARSQGAQLAHEAIAGGASAVLVEDVGIALSAATPVIAINGLRKELGRIASRFYGQPSSTLDIIAVTGTNGKTTIAQLCAQALKHLRGDAGYAGTLGLGRIGDLRRTENTTPDPIALQRFFAELNDHSCHAAAIEVSSHAIVQSRVVGTDIDVAVFSNIGHDHLDYHGSLEAYTRVKKSLFQYDGIRHVVVNLDDSVGREIVNELRADVCCWTYSSQSNADLDCKTRHLYLSQFVGNRAGSTSRVATPDGDVEIKTPLIGDFNAQNLMAALAALMALGIEAVAAAAALSRASSISGRMEVIESGSPDAPLVIVDYAHTPESLARVLVTLRSMSKRRLICVFGCGGDRDKSKRAPMGRVAERGADKLIVTSDNPRGERNQDIVNEILAGMQMPRAVTVIHNRARAIEAAVDAAGADDIVLIAGKGHEVFQESEGVRSPFSDPESAYIALQRGRS
ncbi:MAG: UDP-N-acetylmuramoyl-L-alanyl-D-glutamate--2,6-diaminopimelate ligase [Proteobacteria bacterium]|nr:MAG: UDP-N-acetylmuramoyl-L-alanyl-D-glutamate--2,6-diaminopimelate ligase [Pseudomonadota bacterium]